jgi:hypothetical protein
MTPMRDGPIPSSIWSAAGCRMMCTELARALSVGECGGLESFLKAGAGADWAVPAGARAE